MWEQLKILHHQEAIDGKRTPIHVQIELTERCGHRCRFCHNQNNLNRGKIPNFDFTGKRDFPYARLKKLIQELKDTGTKAISFTGTGEPLLYKDIFDIIKLIIDSGIEFSITTNLDRELSGKELALLSYAKWVRVSFNGWDEKSYMHMHGINNKDSFNRVLLNIQALYHHGHNVNVSYVITKENKIGIVKVTRLMKDISSSISFRHEAGTKRMRKNVYSRDIIKLLERAKVAEDDSFKVYDGMNRLQEDEIVDEDLICHVSNYLVFIAANGDVYPCCTTRWNEKYVYGNILDKSFDEFWKESIGNYCNLHMRTCPPCRHYQDNKILDFIHNKERDNFI